MQHLTEVLTFVVGLVSGYALKVAVDYRSTKSNVTQKRNRVIGDMAGRDINKTK